jgi:acyl-CoA synthetase (NDP forming)
VEGEDEEAGVEEAGVEEAGVEEADGEDEGGNALLKELKRRGAVLSNWLKNDHTPQQLREMCWERGIDLPSDKCRADTCVEKLVEWKEAEQKKANARNAKLRREMRKEATAADAYASRALRTLKCQMPRLAHPWGFVLTV